MRAVIQRVSGASVEIEGRLHAEIGQGLCIFVAVEPTDTREDVEWLAGKISRLRLFNDANGVMNRSVLDLGGDCMVVSQFTLFASTRKGNRPSYIRSAPPEIAVPIYQQFVESLELLCEKPVRTGVFGANMQVRIMNDGPVTILMDSRVRE